MRPMQEKAIEKAIRLCGIQVIGEKLGVTYQAVHKWRASGFPRTEWTGETCYAAKIEAMTNGAVSAQALLEESRNQRRAQLSLVRAA